MYFLKGSFIAVLICIGIVTNAQQRSILIGSVTDTAGSPLPGASVAIHNTKSFAVSGVDGSFRTAPVPPGRYLVEVSYAGFESIIETIDINGSVTRLFVMQPSVTEEQNVIITGVSTATRIRQSPQPVELIKKGALLQSAESNIIEKLTRVPGVSALTTGPAIAKPFIRGLGYNRILTINDGVRQEGQQWGDEHGIEIDDYNVQKVEILKGPASLMYGSDALAGVINIQSLVPAPDGTIRVNAITEYQTNNRLRGGYINVAGSKNGFSFNAYGSHKEAADYKNKYDGYVFNSKFNNTNVGGMIGYGGTWGHSYLSVTSFSQKIGMVEGERDESGNFLKAEPGGDETVPGNSDFRSVSPFVPYQDVNHLKLTSDNTIKAGNADIDLNIAWQNNKRKELGDPDSPSIPEAYFDLNTFTYNARVRLPQYGSWNNSLGISGMQQTNRNRGEEAIIPDYALFDAGAFVFTQYRKNKVTLSGGLRFDSRFVSVKEMKEDDETKFSAFRRSFYNLSGSVGFSYEASDAVAVKFNVARGFRAPSLAELSSNGAHEGTNRYEIGNAGLKSENSLQADAGISLKSEHLNVDAGIYYSNISNFIFYHKLVNVTGGDSVILDDDSGRELDVFLFSQQTVNLYGAEIRLDIHPHPLDWLHFEHIFSITKARFVNAVDGSYHVPNIPAARYIAELRGNFMEKGKRFRNLYVSIKSDYTFRQDSPFTAYHTETATGSYWLLGAGIGVDWVGKKGVPFASIHLTGQNLTDVAYQNHLSRLKYTDENLLTGRRGVFNMGRSFGIKLNIPLGFDWK